MKLIIVHDRPEAAEELRCVIAATIKGPSTIHMAADVVGATNLLRSNHYDLAVVDLTLPIIAGHQEPSLSHAEYLLKTIFADPAVKAPADILGITKDDDALELIRTSIGQHLMGWVKEDLEGHWRDSVAAKVRYVESARRARFAVANSSYDCDLVILTALDKEAKPYEDLFELRRADGVKGAQSFNFTSSDGRLRRGVLFSVGVSGQAPTASAAQALITHYRPRLMLMTGFCGGVRKRTKAGDLLVFRSSYAWDYGKWEDTGAPDARHSSFRPRPTPLNVEERGVDELIRGMLRNGYQPNTDALSMVGRLSKGTLSSWRIERTAAASGSAVVTSLDILEQIRALDENIWAIEMESYAFYYACRNTPVVRPDFICMKSVADFCNGTKDSRWHAPCSAISALFAKDLVTRHYDFEPMAA